MDVPSPNSGRAARSPLVDLLARAGLAARGGVYLLLGWVALQLGLGRHPGTQVNQRGAFQELARQPDGPALLALLAVGLAAYALYRLVDAIWGHREERGGKRLVSAAGSVGRAAAYAVLTYAAVSVLTHRSSSAGSGNGAGLMGSAGGSWLVGAIGIAFLVGGAVLVVSGVTRRFEKHLRTGEMSARVRRVVVVLGVVGTVARGASFALIGWFFVHAAATYDPKEARGLDQSLRELLQHPAGRVAAVAVAIGLIAFGAYSCCEARWRQTGAEDVRNAARPGTPRRLQGSVSA